MQDFTPYRTYTQAIVKPPTFSDAELHALEVAGVAHVSHGKTHWFSRECDADGCKAHYVYQIDADDKLFPGIVAHMCQPYALYCKKHEPAKIGVSLMAYAPKSASAGGNGGSSQGRTHRNRAGRSGDAKVTRKQIEARIKQLAAMIANPGHNTPETQIAAWQAEQDALALTLATWTRRKKVA